MEARVHLVHSRSSLIPKRVDGLTRFGTNINLYSHTRTMYIVPIKSQVYCLALICRFLRCTTAKLPRSDDTPIDSYFRVQKLHFSNRTIIDSTPFTIGIKNDLSQIQNDFFFIMQVYTQMMRMKKKKKNVDMVVNGRTSEG